MRVTPSKVPVVCPATLLRAEGQIVGCEACSNARADTPFYWVLDSIMTNAPVGEERILLQPGKCPKCMRDVLKDTLVQWV